MTRLQAQEVKNVSLSLILSIGFLIYQEGCNIVLLLVQSAQSLMREAMRENPENLTLLC